MPTLKDILLQLATGRTQQQLQDDVSLGKAERLGFHLQPGNLDKGVHRLASYNTAKRFGPMVAETLGGLKEGTDFVGQYLGMGTTAEMGDLRENMIGAHLAAEESKQDLIKRLQKFYPSFGKK